MEKERKIRLLGTAKAALSVYNMTILHWSATIM